MSIKTILLALCLLTAGMGMSYAQDMDHDHGGGTLYHMFRIEKDIGVDAYGKTALNLDARGWVGTDTNKLWLRTQGEHKDGKLQSAELWALYSRNIATFWDAQAGLRYDMKPVGTTYAAFGLNGLAPYFFDTEAHFFISHRGDVTARLREENDLLLTQKLIAQPYLEINMAAQKIQAQSAGAGLSDGKIGLQTRYEFTRSFAPYVDVHYGRKFGETSLMAQHANETPQETIGAIGLRVMF